MIERTFNALFLVVSFTFCLSFITNTEFSQEFAMIEGVVITGYVLMCMIPDFIKKTNWKQKEVILGAITGLGLVILLAFVGAIDPEANQLEWWAYAIVFGCMIAPATIRFILKRYFRKKDDENGH